MTPESALLLWHMANQVAEDIVEIQDTGATYWSPSAVSTINGEDATKFLEDFAVANVQGFTEPNADWNGLMSSAAYDIQNLYTVFEGGSMFYPGDTIIFNFENGSTSGEISWIAQLSPLADVESVPAITTGQEFYDWFVLGVDSTPPMTGAPPTAANTSAIDYSADNSTDTTSPTPTDVNAATSSSWNNVAYPTDPIIVQPNLSSDSGLDGGVVTGYLLNDGVTAVLSLPSFSLNGENDRSFSSTVSDFITRSKAAGRTKVIIDLQRNQGGSFLLAVDTFKQFFPTLDPFRGQRARAVATADALGNTFTQYFDTHHFTDDDDPSYADVAASVWTATDYLNAATNANFTSWDGYYGPHSDHGDQFTTVSRDNLSSIIFDEQSADIVVTGYANDTNSNPPPFSSVDTILLTDGTCSSACALFVEMMHHEGGARIIVAGGRPDLSQMQAVGGSKGALIYDTISLDGDIDTAIQLNASVQSSLPKGRDDLEPVIYYASFNIEDAVRKDSDTPLQFTYEAADCRIYYTHHTVYNYINLWNYVIDALYRNPSLCIASSSASPPMPVPTSVGAGISAKFYQPINASQRRRDLGSSPIRPIFDARAPTPNSEFYPEPQELSSFALDARQEASSCPVRNCVSSREQACFGVPACGLPVTCKKTCNTFNECSKRANNNVCERGFCITHDENDKLRSEKCRRSIPISASKAKERGRNSATNGKVGNSGGSVGSGASKKAPPSVTRRAKLKRALERWWRDHAKTSGD